jgi:hypothetical protein
LWNPALPGPWIQPRVDADTWLIPTRTRMPCARACSSVSPAAPTSGSVKVTRLSPR